GDRCAAHARSKACRRRDRSASDACTQPRTRIAGPCRRRAAPRRRPLWGRTPQASSGGPSLTRNRLNSRTRPLIQGLWCATLTPLARNGGIDHARFAAHAQALLAQGVDGVAPFGTTGEGQSFAADERRAGLDALLSAGVSGQKIVAATGCAALPETIALSPHALAAGCIACLVLPPFFWKDATDDGLFTWYAQVIDAVGDPRLRIFLYHIPQVSGTPLSVDLIARLAGAFPGVIAGVKDSAGDWSNTEALLARVPQLAILVGHDPHLPSLMRAGGP